MITRKELTAALLHWAPKFGYLLAFVVGFLVGTML